LNLKLPSADSLTIWSQAPPPQQSIPSYAPPGHTRDRQTDSDWSILRPLKGVSEKRLSLLSVSISAHLSVNS